MLNVVVLMGRLTKDPELSYTKSDIAKVRFTLAVDRNYTKQGEDKQTDFINVNAWRKTAEFIAKYFSKGSLLALQGELHVDNYTDRNGEKRTWTSVTASNVSFCGSKRDAGQPVSSATPTDDGDYHTSDDDLPF